MLKLHKEVNLMNIKQVRIGWKSMESIENVL